MLKSKLLFFGYLLFIISNQFYAQKNENEKKIDSLHIVVKQALNATEKIDALLSICDYYRKITTENLDSLSFYAHKIIKITDSVKNFDERKIDALDHLAFAAYYRRENDLAKKYINDYKIISERINYGIGLCNASYLSAYLSLDENDVNMYIYQLENAYQLAKEYKVPEPLIFKMGVGLSSGYSVYNFNSNLISNVLLEIQSLIDNPKISLLSKGTFYLDLGTLYESTNDYENAKINYEKAIQLFKEDNNPYYLYAPLNNLARYYQNKGNHYKAITIFKEALALKVRESYAKIYNNLGSSFFYLKEYNKAENYFKKAINEYKAKNDLFGEADCLNWIGAIYQQKNATKQANSFFDLAIKKYLKDVNLKRKYNVDKSQITSSYSKISNIYKEKKDFKKSLAYHKLYANYKDSIAIEQNLKATERYHFFVTKNEKNNIIKNLENKNKLQEVNAAKANVFKNSLILLASLILLLLIVVFNRNRLKQRAIKTIKEKNEENKLLMREIHHRVENNLDIILNLFESQINNSNNEQLKLILEDSQNKIKSMAIIHQNLYNTNQFSRVSINTYIHQLINHIKNSFSKNNVHVQFNLDISPTLVLIELAIPLGLVLNELITNSFKFAFSDKNKTNNKISITFVQIKESSTYKLIVKDNGVGLPKDFDPENLTSFGMELVQGLVAQLNGTVEIIREKGLLFSIIVEEPTTT